MAESIFGSPADPVSRGGADDTPAWLREEPTTEPRADAAAEGTPAEPAAPEATPEPTTDETPAPSTPQGVTLELSPEELEALRAANVLSIEGEQPATEQAAEGTTQEQLAEAAERLYANKYKNAEELERGYRERSDMWRRALEAQKAEEAARIQAEQERAQYEQALRSAIPILEQAAQRERQVRVWAEQVRQETGAYPQGYDPSAAPAQGQPAGMSQQDVQRMLEERLAAERQQMAATFQRQQEAAALEASVLSFYEEHPEVEPNGALDTEITDAMAELDESPAWASVRNPDGTFGVIVDPTDRGSLDVLYEAVNRPALLEILKLKPEYFTSEAGLQIARRDAAVLEGVPATTVPRQATVPASRAGQSAGRKIPFAESAAGTLPEDQGPDLTDPWEAIKAYGRPKEGERARSIFAE